MRNPRFAFQLLLDCWLLAACQAAASAAPRVVSCSDCLAQLTIPLGDLPQGTRLSDLHIVKLIRIAGLRALSWIGVLRTFVWNPTASPAPNPFRSRLFSMAPPITTSAGMS
jgi:hypothetical protein